MWIDDLPPSTAREVATGPQILGIMYSVNGNFEFRNLSEATYAAYLLSTPHMIREGHQPSRAPVVLENGARVALGRLKGFDVVAEESDLAEETRPPDAAMARAEYFPAVRQSDEFPLLHGGDMETDQTGSLKTDAVPAAYAPGPILSIGRNPYNCKHLLGTDGRAWVNMRYGPLYLSLARYLDLSGAD